MRVNMERTASAFAVMSRPVAREIPPRPSEMPPPPSDMASEIEAGADRDEDDHRDVAVDVEEGEVEAREIARAHERVLVGEEAEHGEPAYPVREAEPRDPAEEGQGRCREGVVHARRHEGRGDAEARGHGVEPLR